MLLFMMTSITILYFIIYRYDVLTCRRNAKFLTNLNLKFVPSLRNSRVPLIFSFALVSCIFSSDDTSFVVA